MNINLSFLLTALAIFINFSLVQTRPELFVSETVIETESENHSHVVPDVILTQNIITISTPAEVGMVEYTESSLLLLEKFYTVFPSDIPPPLS